MKKILIPTLLATVATPAMSLISCGNQEPINAIDFNTCEWTDVIDACKNLEDGTWKTKQFCQRFKFGSAQATSLDDFIGQTRTIKLNGKEHKVFVVGYQQDYQDKEKAKPVALTFQFGNLVSNESGYALSPKWDTADNSNYWESILCDELNNDSEDAVTSVYEMIKIADSSLASAIKSVNRNVCTKVETSWQQANNQTKLFCPTLSNIFSNKGIDETRGISEGNALLYKGEGQPHGDEEQAQYMYYTSEIGDSPMENQSQQAIPFDCLVRKDCSNEPYAYWLSSALLSVDNKACAIDKDGKRIYYEVNLEAGGTLAPCFCL